MQSEEVTLTQIRDLLGQIAVLSPHFGIGREGATKIVTHPAASALRKAEADYSGGGADINAAIAALPKRTVGGFPAGTSPYGEVAFTEGDFDFASKLSLNIPGMTVALRGCGPPNFAQLLGATTLNFALPATDDCVLVDNNAVILLRNLAIVGDGVNTRDTLVVGTEGHSGFYENLLFAGAVRHGLYEPPGVNNVHSNSNNFFSNLYARELGKAFHTHGFGNTYHALRALRSTLSPSAGTGEAMNLGGLGSRFFGVITEEHETGMLLDGDSQRCSYHGVMLNGAMQDDHIVGLKIDGANSFNIFGLEIFNGAKTGGGAALVVADALVGAIYGLVSHGSASGKGVDVQGSSEITFFNPVIGEATPWVATTNLTKIFGYAGWARNQANILSGTTSITVTHGVVGSASWGYQQIMVCPINNLGNATKWWVSNQDATSFRINVDVDPGASQAQFVWWVGNI